MSALKLPVDLQSFEIIRREGFLYVDKTPYIHKMLEEGRYYFMARLRRFKNPELLGRMIEPLPPRPRQKSALQKKEEHRPRNQEAQERKSASVPRIKRATTR